MLITYKAIVLSSIKYADQDLIVRCYTEQGTQSFMVKRIFKSSKGKLTPALFLPLTQLEITADYSAKRSLQYIRDAKIGYPYTTVFSSVIKQTISIFLAEILADTLREEEQNEALFTYLETALQYFDSHQKIANFHLVFLCKLTRYLGFYPSQVAHTLYFDLLNGKFVDHLESRYFISGENLTNFKTLLDANFENVCTLALKKEERRALLEILLQYFELQLPTFKQPRSLEVLKTVFQ